MNHRPLSQTRRAARALFGSWLGTLLCCLGVLAPKCPLCLAAYLCLFGVSASSARAAVQLGVPLCVALIASSTLATAWFVARRARSVADSSQREPAAAARFVRQPQAVLLTSDEQVVRGFRDGRGFVFRESGQKVTREACGHGIALAGGNRVTAIE